MRCPRLRLIALSVRGPCLPRSVSAGLPSGHHRLRTRRRDRRRHRRPAVPCHGPCAAWQWRPPGSGLPTHSPAATTPSTRCSRSAIGRRSGRPSSPLALALARSGRTEQAAVILGGLDAHSPVRNGIRTHFRDRARAASSTRMGTTNRRSSAAPAFRPTKSSLTPWRHVPAADRRLGQLGADVADDVAEMPLDRVGPDAT